jgi:zinc D-Ala-D-Ala carboxypeptidase
MKPQRFIKISSVLLISSSILLTACSSQSSTVSDSGQSGQSTSIPAATDANTLSLSADHYILAPGASQKLTLWLTNKKQAKTDISSQKDVTYKSSTPEAISIDAAGTIKASTQAKIGTKANITISYQGQSVECAVVVKYALQDTIAVNANGKKVLSNPTDIAVVVNKQRLLPDRYVPADLIEPNVPFTFKGKSDKRMMRSEAAHALEQLFAEAAKENIHLFGVSAYRSFVTQQSVFAGNVKDMGQSEANKVSAVPGQSEHQTGLAIDVTNSNPKDSLVESFGASTEGQWVAAHAADFGFIIRYPKGKESLTGYAYEPWHIRYVGIDIAKEVYEKGITLEQYFDDAIAVSK